MAQPQAERYLRKFSQELGNLNSREVLESYSWSGRWKKSYEKWT